MLLTMIHFYFQQVTLACWETGNLKIYARNLLFQTFGITKTKPNPTNIYLGEGNSGHNYVPYTFWKIVLNFLGFFQCGEGLIVKEILHLIHSQKLLANANVLMKSCLCFDKRTQIQHWFNLTSFFGPFAELNC